MIGIPVKSSLGRNKGKNGRIRIFHCRLGLAADGLG
jgi:hypothetical protein